MSCARSAVLARRYRNARDTMAARPEAATSTRPLAAMTLKMSPAGPVTPTGFGGEGLMERIVGPNALPSTHPARPAPAAQATGRQRREGNFPVGNSSTTNTHSPRATNQIQPSQLARVSVRGKCDSTISKIPTEYARPLADNSHPIGFSGRLHASSAPTVAKAVTNTSATTQFAPLPPWLASLAGSGFKAL